MESRRSNPNLNYLTLSPISSRLPLDESDDENPEVPTPWAHRSSYIANKSAPTTPRILSRSPSTTRHARSTSTKLSSSKSYTNLEFADFTQLQTSKSTTHMIGAFPKKKTKSVSRLSGQATDHGEWLFRSGAAISSEAREYKGQSWLVSRDSSTSLVAQNEESDDGARRHKQTGSGRASRAASRLPSARNSRRGSRVGSRPDLTYLATPAGIRTPASGRTSHDAGDYFSRGSDIGIYAEPDFLDDDEADEESDDEEEGRRQEEEVRKLTDEEALGLGGLVERVLGWTFLNVKDDGYESDHDDTPPEKPKEKKIAAKAAAPKPPVKIDAAPEKAESYGWTDAAWLLSVASKILF